jgi:integrase
MNTQPSPGSPVNLSLSKKGRKKAAEFTKAGGVENLYWRQSTQCYVTRVTISGRRSWHSLDTDVLTVAKLRQKERAVEIEKDRQRGGGISRDYRTLGQLLVEFERRLADDAEVTQKTKETVADNANRLRAHWQRGNFATYPARNVNIDVIVELRNFLMRDAKVFLGRPGRATKFRQGYSNLCVNQTIGVLRTILDIAIDKRTLVENPFSAAKSLRKRILLRQESKKPDLPSRTDLDRIFAEMRRPAHGRVDMSAGWQKQQQERADAAADFAEFLAYSGCRHEEANSIQVQFVRPSRHHANGEIYIPGTKSGSSERTIPIIKPLRRLIDRIKRGRTSGKLLSTTRALEPLQNACARLGFPKLTQHHLRHYFATLCIERGVDIPTVSSWLGHSDGGVLAMRTYGHLRKEHSFAMADRVDIGPDVPAGGAQPEITTAGNASQSIAG